MPAAETYLKPEVIRQIRRLDLRAQFVVRGFLQGLHRSPMLGFSTEFSEHRLYNPGQDDPRDIDWTAYAKTDRYYVKKFQAETTLTGYLVVDCSKSMPYTYRQELTKFDYAICLAASLAYLMIYQKDPVGLITFDQTVRNMIPPRTRRSHLPQIISHLAGLQATRGTDFVASMTAVASLLRHQSLVMIFSDLIEEEAVLGDALRRVRHGGHDVILFHILDEAEVTFPFTGMVELEDPETGEVLTVDARGLEPGYRAEIDARREALKRRCFGLGIDYVPLDTSMQFDRALTEYLMHRRMRR